MIIFSLTWHSFCRSGTLVSQPQIPWCTMLDIFLPLHLKKFFFPEKKVLLIGLPFSHWAKNIQCILSKFNFLNLTLLCQCLLQILICHSNLPVSLFDKIEISSDHIEYLISYFEMKVRSGLTNNQFIIYTKNATRFEFLQLIYIKK